MVVFGDFRYNVQSEVSKRVKQPVAFFSQQLRVPGICQTSCLLCWEKEEIGHGVDSTLLLHRILGDIDSDNLEVQLNSNCQRMTSACARNEFRERSILHNHDFLTDRPGQ